MRIFDRKQAYSLAEIMTVLLVLTVLLAGFAPMITKRRVNVKGVDLPWDFHDLQEYSARTNPKSATDRNQMFFGVAPSTGANVQDQYDPPAKFVIRSGVVTGGKVQRQLQFRYGLDNETSKTTDRGKFAGTWFIDGKNVLMGGRYPNIDPEPAGNSANTAIGYDALTSIKSTTSGTTKTAAIQNTAIGYNALKNITTQRNNVAIGYRAGESNNQSQNTFIGANAGSNNTGKDNTIAGYSAGAGNGSGNYNTYFGAYAGQNTTTGSYNVAIGANALKNISTGSNNIALGYGALSSLTTGTYNVAIGYNACSGVTSGSFKTCIGYNSGPKSGTKGVGNYIQGWSDSIQRTYIGSKPTNYGGDAVLEIHNPPTPPTKELMKQNGILQYLTGMPSNTTTIVNGNLIVRGKTFFTSGQILYHLHELTGGDYFKTIYGALASNDDICSIRPTSYDFSNDINANCKTYDIFSSASNGMFSDRRLKNIGAKNTSGLDKLSQLKIYNYTFKNDEKKLPHVGVMAQDLQKVFPNSVFQGSDGFLRIKLDEMFFATINAVKELDQKIVSLVNRVFRIETQLAKLEKENTLLKSQVEQLSTRVQKLKAQ